MPKIQQLSPHIANLIAAGEVVERPASVAKELLENAVDAGASQVTLEIRNGGMTFLRVTDNGCGMAPEDAKTAFLRHATSKLRCEEDLAAIQTMGFRGEALAAVASVSRIDLLTKTPGSLSGTSLHLEAGVLMEETEAGCPDGTTIAVRDLFFNTPARMKFMKSDTVEAGKVHAVVQQQALAHPEVAFRFIRDGKEILSTPGSGSLEAAAYCVYGRECARMVQVSSHWENYSLSGYVSKSTDARPSRAMQTFFVNHRPVRSRLLVAALEEAYRNQLLPGKFPACVLHLTLPANAVDVNVHPAKTEVKFLNEKAVFDCIHYGVLGALNKTPDRPQVQFKPQAQGTTPPPLKAAAPRQESFFRTMTAEEYKAFSQVLREAPQPSKAASAATCATLERSRPAPLQEQVVLPKVIPPSSPQAQPETQNEPAQVQLAMPAEIPWRVVGELYNCYILVEQGEDAYLIDKHAAHERILFEKLKENQESISAQMLLSPVSCTLPADSCAILLENKTLLEQLGFVIEEFGGNTLLVRQIPMDLSPEGARDALEAMASDLQSGKRESATTVRDNLLHTVACKAAIKAGWLTDEKERLALVRQVMQREDLKHCPHGRPICVSLSKKMLEKQFKRG